METVRFSLEENIEVWKVSLKSAIFEEQKAPAGMYFVAPYL